MDRFEVGVGDALLGGERIAGIAQIAIAVCVELGRVSERWRIIGVRGDVVDGWHVR